MVRASISTRCILGGLFLVVLAACNPPFEPPCVHLMVALPGHTLPADSLAAEGWKVLPGDTLATKEIECDETPRETA